MDGARLVFVMTLDRCSLCWVLSSATILGCGAGADGNADGAGPAAPGGQTGEETVGCVPVERDALAWNERSPLGFSADELLESLGNERDARLTWSDGASTSLELGLERGGGSVEFQRRDEVGDGSGAEIAVECNDVLSIPVVLSFSTGDGAFAEAWPLTLLAETSSRVSASTRIDLDALEGSFTVTELDPSEFDDVVASLSLTLGGGPWTGSLSGQALTAGTSDPDSTASATHFDIATF